MLSICTGTAVKDNRRSCYMLDALAAGGGFPGILPQSLRKSSSCSTIYIGQSVVACQSIAVTDDSTISQPNLKNTIKCISLAIYYHIANRKNRGHERLMEIFEERLHPITVSPFTVFTMSTPERTHARRTCHP